MSVFLWNLNIHNSVGLNGIHSQVLEEAAKGSFEATFSCLEKQGREGSLITGR